VRVGDDQILAASVAFGVDAFLCLLAYPSSVAVSVSWYLWRENKYDALFHEYFVFCKFLLMESTKNIFSLQKYTLGDIVQKCTAELWTVIRQSRFSPELR
jgi:hypothetical protein